MSKEVVEAESVSLSIMDGAASRRPEEPWSAKQRLSGEVYHTLVHTPVMKLVAGNGKGRRETDGTDRPPLLI
jgi:hypothetical protein